MLKMTGASLPQKFKFVKWDLIEIIIRDQSLDLMAIDHLIGV